MRHFRCRHSCGHAETHRITMQQPTPRDPTDAELDAILTVYQGRPCNACLAGLPVGTHFYTLDALPHRSEVLN